jgi:hypothetical protein
MPGDPNAMGGMEAGMDPAAMGMDPAMGGAPQDPMAMQGAIDQAVAALQPFTAAGADPLGADPMAGQAPVTGMPPGDPAMADPAMAGAAPAMLMEKMVNQYRKWKLQEKGTSKITKEEFEAIKEEVMKQVPKSKYAQIKQRIAERQAQLEAMQENSMGPLTVPQMANSNLWKHNKGNSSNPENSNDPSLIEKFPDAKQAANGVDGKVKGKVSAPSGSTWPTKATGKEAGGALQGAGATQKKLGESEVKTVTDVYVDRYFEPKLDFTKLKESMKKGLLG